MVDLIAGGAPSRRAQTAPVATVAPNPIRPAQMATFLPSPTTVPISDDVRRGCGLAHAYFAFESSRGIVSAVADAASRGEPEAEDTDEASSLKDRRFNITLGE